MGTLSCYDLHHGLVGGVVHGVGTVGSGMVHGVGTVGSGMMHGVGTVGSGMMHGVGTVGSEMGKFMRLALLHIRNVPKITIRMQKPVILLISQVRQVLNDSVEIVLAEYFHQSKNWTKLYINMLLVQFYDPNL